MGSNFSVSDIPVAAFGSRAHLEEKALATVKYFLGQMEVIIMLLTVSSLSFILMKLWFLINILTYPLAQMTYICHYFDFS